MTERGSHLFHISHLHGLWSRISKSTAMGMALLMAGGAAGFLGFQAWAKSGRPDPLREISSGFLYMDLDREGPGSSRAALFPDRNVPREKRRVFQWAQSTYHGVLDRQSIATLIQAGRAASLEGRLSPAASAELARSMASQEKELKEMILLVEEENQEAKKTLKARPDRHVLLKQKPYSKDPAYGRLQKLTSLTRGGKGVVWGDLAPHGELQLILLWKEWPGLKRLHDRRFAMLERRRVRVRQWIEQAFLRNGMTLFGS